MESAVEEEGGTAVYIINTYLPPIRKKSLYVYIKKTGGKVTLFEKFFLKKFCPFEAYPKRTAKSV